MLNHLQSIYRFRSIGFDAICFPVSLAFGVLSPPSAPISIVPFRARVVFACAEWILRLNDCEQHTRDGWAVYNLCFSISMRSASACSASALFLSCLLIFFLPIFVLNSLQMISWPNPNRVAPNRPTMNGNIEQITRSFPWESCVCVCALASPIFKLSRLCSIYLLHAALYVRVCAHCSIFIVNKEVISHKFYFHFKISRFRSVLTNKSTCNCAQTWTKKKEKKTKTKNNNRLKWPRLLRPNFE